MIRNVVFDMGNVLVRFEPEYFIRREGVDDPEEIRLIRNELFLSVEWAQMDSGVLTEKTAEPSLLARFPKRMHPVVSRLLYSWAYPRETVPGMEKLVQRLKSAGYRIYLLSNASAAHHEYWPRFSISCLFDGIMISCDEKVVKPCPKIYRLFTERFSLKPEECVFIDDLPANAAAAVDCGWQGIVFHGDADELEDKLKGYGLVF